MKKIITLWLLVTTVGAFAADDCLCWIDAKTGKQVPTVPVGILDGFDQANANDTGQAHNPRLGRNYVRLPNGHCWIDAKTGKQVPTVPVGILDGFDQANANDTGQAHNPRLGQNYVRVPCPEEKPATDTNAVKTAAAPAAKANDLFQFSLGYSFMHPDKEEVKNLHGFQVAGFYNVNSWLAAGVQFSGLYGSQSIGSADVSLDRYLYLIGPQVTVQPFSQWPQVNVTCHVLVGGVHDENKVSYGGKSYNSSADAFAMSVGAGVDVQVARHVTVGPWLDYAPTAFSAPGTSWQNNWAAGFAAKVKF